jgi:RNA polymerase sigma-70 factor, ECF subfamily
MGDLAITLLDPTESAATRPVPDIDALFNAHHRQIFRAAYRVTGSLQDAEDILQTVFLRLLAAREASAVGDNPTAYLCRTAINASIDLLRVRNRTQHESLTEDEHPATQGHAETMARQAELQQLLRDAMLRLDGQAAEVFALRHFADFSNAQIAAMLDASPNSIGVTLHRARIRLQEILGEFEGDNP